MADETMRIVVERIDRPDDGDEPTTATATDSLLPDSSEQDRGSKADLFGSFFTKVIEKVAPASAEGFSAATASMEGFAGKVNVVTATLQVANEVFIRMKDSALEFAQKIEQFSPNVSIANARREVTQMDASFKADAIAGPELAKLIDAQSRTDAVQLQIDATINKWGAELSRPIEEIKAQLLEFLLKALQFIDKSLDELAVAGERGDKVLSILSPAYAVIKSLLDAMNKKPLEDAEASMKTGFDAIFQPLPLNRPTPLNGF